MALKLRAAALVLGLLCLSHLASSAPSLQCTQDIAAYIAGITPLDPKIWAVKMFDSSAKFPADGLLQGTFLMQMGHYDQCLATKGPDNSDGEPRFSGKYCRVQVGFKTKRNNTDAKTELLMAQMEIAYDSLKDANTHLMPGGANNYLTETLANQKDVYIPSQWGVCAPSSCNADGVKIIADFNIGLFFNALNMDVTTIVAERSCHFEGDGKKDLTVGAWIFLIFTLLLSFLLLTTTAVEYVWPKDKELNVLIKAFSLRTNLTELFTLPKRAFPGQLTCLNGIRVISTWWVILLHCYMVNIYSPHLNAAMALNKYPYQWTSAPLLSGALSVDTFFFLSGLLTVYVPLQDQKKGRPFNVFKYYIYRYLRITGPVAMLLFYLATIHKLTGQGPLWNLLIEYQTERCENYWWATLLYMVNYYKPFETPCINQAWYLMVDMQLALLAPIVIFPMLKWPKIGIALTSVLTLGSMAAAFAFTYVHNFPWTITFLVPVQSTGNFMTMIYANTIVRATPYLLGMLLAYILANKMTIKMPNWWVALEWILNTVLCLALVYVIIIPYSRDYVYEKLGASFFAAFHRVGWSIGIAWVIWACVNGYSGPVNAILSWKYFVPLSKLSFCAYLVHMDIMYYHVASLRTYSFFSHFELVYEFFGNLIMMIPMTLFLYLAVDAPMQTLMRALFKKPSKIAETPVFNEEKKTEKAEPLEEKLHVELDEIKSSE